MESFTPPNTRHEEIWHKVLHLHDIPTPSAPKVYVIGLDPGRWCKFHRVKGYHTKDCYQLKKEIECLIQEGLMNRYDKGESSHGSCGTNSYGHDKTRSLRPRKRTKPSKEDGNKVVHHTLTLLQEDLQGTGRLAPLRKDMHTRY